MSGGILSTTHNRAETIQIETSDEMNHRPSPAKRLKKQDTEGPTWYAALKSLQTGFKQGANSILAP